MFPFDVRWTINDLEVKAVGSKSHTYWPPKVLLSQGKNMHNNTNHLQPILWMGFHYMADDT